MAVRKHGKKWRADVTNRELSVRIRKTFKTRKEATEAEAEIKLKLKNSRMPRAGIEAALKNYLVGEALSLKDSGSVKSKSRAIAPYIVGKSFDDIGQVTYQIKSSMLSDGLAPATINRRLALLRRSANLAYDWGWIDSPVGKRVKLLPGEVSRHYYLTNTEVDDFVKLCPCTGILIKIAAYTGMRRGELFKLDDDSIKDDFIILKSDTKTGKPRLIPIPAQIESEIASLELPLDSGLDYLLRQEWEEARKALGKDYLRFHDLRHSYASWLAQAGATLQLIG